MLFTLRVIDLSFGSEGTQYLLATPFFLNSSMGKRPCSPLDSYWTIQAQLTQN